MELSQQYCLKWNNHPSNISGVFHRLRSSEQFVDVTLSSADRKTVKCHRLLLSAGSGYLEDILSSNPSDHPTVVLSQIKYRELKLLVDFMYAGEVAVEQERLPTLLEAARILKIKGLWENEKGEDDERDNVVAAKEEEEDEEEEEEMEPAVSVLKDTIPTNIRSSLDSILGNKMTLNFNSSAMTTTKTMTSNSNSVVVGSQKRKRKKNSQDERNVVSSSCKVPSPPSSTTHSNNDEDLSNNKVYSPLFGVSNAYFLTNRQQPQTDLLQQQTNNKAKVFGSSNGKKRQKTGGSNSSSDGSSSIGKMMIDIPALLSQASPLPPTMHSGLNLPLVPPPLTIHPPSSFIEAKKTSSMSSLSPPTNLFNLSPGPKLPIPDFLSQLAAKTSEGLKNGGNHGSSSSSSLSSGTFSLNLPGGLLLASSTPVRRYKQYTEDSLQQALREIMEGQSINRSSMKFNIPARTLRDWMKRLNIKSVFTHHTQKEDGEEDDDEDEDNDEDRDDEEREEMSGNVNIGNPAAAAEVHVVVARGSTSSQGGSSMDEMSSSNGSVNGEEEEDVKATGIAFPGMLPQALAVSLAVVPPPTAAIKEVVKTPVVVEDDEDDEEEEEEIDDDEEECLKIDDEKQ